jgi:hypothetical protein
MGVGTYTPFHMRTEADPVSETLCSVQNTMQLTKSRNPLICSVEYHCDRPSELANCLHKGRHLVQKIEVKNRTLYIRICLSLPLLLKNTNTEIHKPMIYLLFYMSVNDVTLREDV